MGLRLVDVVRIRPLAAALTAMMGLLLAACGSASMAEPNDSAITATGSVGRAAGHLRLVSVGKFDQPVYLTGAPADRKRVFVVQKPGKIAVLVNGHALARPFLDITSVVNSGGEEQGLLSMAFAPDYPKSGRFYVDYTSANGDIHVAQYRRSGHNADLAAVGSARAVITIAHRDAPNHNGGQLQFGPDGDLYIGVGDGGNEGDPKNNGQNTAVLVGKILRISPKPDGGYTIPASNPFHGSSGKRPEIWAYGLRNPFRFSFDRLTGDLVIGDVGQDSWEEIDFAPRGTGAGANYGWSIWEGDHHLKAGTAPHAVFPVLEKSHQTEHYCAVIGGYVVRDRSVPSLYGRYVYGDLCHAGINSVKLSAGHARADRPIGLTVSSMSSFGEDTAGHIYAISLSGQIFRIAG
jgi:glucose/arabinose dehydrogenase